MPLCDLAYGHAGQLDRGSERWTVTRSAGDWTSSSAPTHGVGKAHHATAISIRAWLATAVSSEDPSSGCLRSPRDRSRRGGGGWDSPGKERDGLALWGAAARLQLRRRRCRDLAHGDGARSQLPGEPEHRRQQKHATRRPRALCHCERTAETRRGRHSTARRGGGGRERTSRARTGGRRAWLARDGGAPSPGL